MKQKFNHYAGVINFFAFMLTTLFVGITLAIATFSFTSILFAIVFTIGLAIGIAIGGMMLKGIVSVLMFGLTISFWWDTPVINSYADPLSYLGDPLMWCALCFGAIAGAACRTHLSATDKKLTLA